MKKSINELVPRDFNYYLVWQPVDDLEDSDMEVIPYQGEVFNMEEIYLVATKYYLADGSEQEGYIRFSWGTPIEMALAISDGEFLFWGIERNVETEEEHEKFALKLRKKIDEVFPLNFQTMVKLHFQGTVY